MAKSASEQAADFLLEFLPDLLPKPVDSAAKAAVSTFKDQLDALLAQPRIKKELLEAAQQAERNFHTEARKQMKSDELVQAVASFPLFDNALFQCSLAKLPEHLNEDFLARDLQGLIADDWKGKFTPNELREGVVIYLNCLRVQLLKVDGYADLVTRLAILRTDDRTEQILKIVNELLALVGKLLERTAAPTTIAATLFTIPPPMTDFTGRDEELKKLKGSFANGAIITGVSGGGGVGKTELARKLAQDIAPNFPDARMEINLMGISEIPLTSEEAMRRLIEPLYPNQLKGLYQQKFGKFKALLLLDNAADAHQVRPLIPPAPSVAIITSRQHFTLAEFGLKEPLRLDVLEFADARTLLRSASEKLKEAPDKQLDELSSFCGRLPLALRVAASLLSDSPNWTPGNLIDRLKDERTRLERLKREGDQDLDVEAALSLSYKLLDDNFKKYFRMVSVFTAPFLNFSTKAVWGMSDEDDLEGVLNKLVNRSLLNVLPSPLREGQGSEVLWLYTLQDLTRLFGTKRLLENTEETQETIVRHAEHFLEWASFAEYEYLKGGEHIVTALGLFRFIWPHLFAAYERLLPEQKYFPRPASADKWLSDFPGKCAYVMDLHLPPRLKIPILQNALGASGAWVISKWKEYISAPRDRICGLRQDTQCR